MITWAHGAKVVAIAHIKGEWEDNRNVCGRIVEMCLSAPIRGKNSANGKTHATFNVMY